MIPPPLGDPACPVQSGWSWALGCIALLFNERKREDGGKGKNQTKTTKQANNNNKKPLHNHPETQLVSQLVAELPCSDSRSPSNFFSHCEASSQTLAACLQSSVPLRGHSANSSRSLDWDGFLRWAHSHPILPVSFLSLSSYFTRIYFSLPFPMQITPHMATNGVFSQQSSWQEPVLN